MTKTLKFETPGLGIGQAADWFTINGQRVWVSFMSASEGKGKRRLWSVTATHYNKEAKPVRVTVTMPNSFRYQVADAALTELSNHI